MNKKKPLSFIGILVAIVLMFFGFNVDLDSFGILDNNPSINTESSYSIEQAQDNQNANIETEQVQNNQNTNGNTEQVYDTELIPYEFRSDELLHSHYDKHKDEFGDITLDEYTYGATKLLNKVSDTVITKTEKDGDELFFDTATGEFGVLSTDGYIRTYFIPDDGIEYYNRK